MGKLAHKGDAVIARFTPDGKTVITGGRTDGLVRLWDRATGAMRNSLNGHGFVLSPDGGTLATVEAAGEIILYNSATRARIGSLPGAPGIQAAIFSHDGTKLATVHEREALIQVWEVPSRRLRVFHRSFGNEGFPSTGGVFGVAFSADDQTIITAAEDGTIRFWGVSSGVQRGVHQGHTGRIWSLALSPDGRTIASAGRDGTVRLSDAEPPRDHIKLPVVQASQIGFSADDQCLLTLEFEPAPELWPNYPMFVDRWDSSSGLRLKRTRLDRDGYPITAVFSRDGRVLAIEYPRGTVTIWDVVTGHQQGMHALMPGQDVREFSPDSHRLLLAGPEQWSFLDINAGRRIPLPWPKLITATFTPTGAILAVPSGGSVSEWGPSTGQIRTFPIRHTDFPDRMAISGDGNTLAMVSPGSPVIRLVSTKTFELKAELAGHPAGTGRLAFAPDGKTLASTGAERTVKLWDLATSDELLTLEGFSGPIWTILFSPDGRALATLFAAPHGSNQLFLWHTAQEEPDPAAIGQGSSVTLAH
jgi:WD40 repeat protein